MQSLASLLGSEYLMSAVQPLRTLRHGASGKTRVRRIGGLAWWKSRLRVMAVRLTCTVSLLGLLGYSEWLTAGGTARDSPVLLDPWSEGHPAGFQASAQGAKLR